MDLSIVTVTWNSEKFIAEQLRSVFASEGPATFEVFVVDNASTDGTRAQLAQVRRQFPQVQCVENTENVGFARANNQAIAHARGRYVLLLNPDMRVFPNTLACAVQYMDAHPEVGVMGPHLVDAQGKTVPHVRRFPTWKDQIAIVLKLPHIFPGILRKYLFTDFDYTKEALVDSVRGSFFLIRREVIEKLGGLDERYFIWFEEVDYCKQVWAAGWKIAYTPEVTCRDYVGRSFALVAGYRKQRYFTGSMVIYFKKWHARWQSLALQCVRPLALALAWVAQVRKQS